MDTDYTERNAQEERDSKEYQDSVTEDAIFQAKKEGFKQGLCDLRAETLARFFVARFGVTPPFYFSEWVERFKDGREWWSMDEESTITYLSVLSTPWGGTREAFSSKYLKGELK